MSFERRVDPACQRGLTFVYRVQTSPVLEVFDQAIGPSAQRSQQRWGERQVDIWIVPRRYECQFGVRALEIRFMHRFSSDPDQRAADQAAFEVALMRSLS